MNLRSTGPSRAKFNCISKLTTPSFFSGAHSGCLRRCICSIDKPFLGLQSGPLHPPRLRRFSSKVIAIAQSSLQLRPSLLLIQATSTSTRRSRQNGISRVTCGIIRSYGAFFFFSIYESSFSLRPTSISCLISYVIRRREN